MDRMWEVPSPPMKLSVLRRDEAQAGDQVRSWRQVGASTALAVRTVGAGGTLFLGIIPLISGQYQCLGRKLCMLQHGDPG